MNDDSSRSAWAYLSSVAQGPCGPLSDLVAAVGADDAARAVREWDLPPALQKVTQSRRHLDTAADDLELIESLGGRFVTPDDAEWPSWRMLAFDGCDSGRESELVAPLGLWVLGTASLAELTDRAIGVVGTRAPSNYGTSVTADIASDLAAQGWTIVSGAAFGVDAAAHRAALAVEGASIAVLACGVDRAYPAAHQALLRRIAEDGLVVSEYAPNTTPQRHRFLERNRLIAVLSDAVAVIEAGRRSGARNTAKWARRLGRPALAVPGSVNSTTSVGCNQMIREGEAILVANASDVLVEAGPLRLPVDDSTVDQRVTDGLIGDQLLVYEALPAVGGLAPQQLAEASGLPIGNVRAALPMLELAGFVVSDESGWHRVRQRRAS